MQILLLIDPGTEFWLLAYPSVYQVDSLLRQLGHDVCYLDISKGMQGFSLELPPKGHCTAKLNSKLLLESFDHPCIKESDCILNATSLSTSQKGWIEHFLEVNGLRIMSNGYRVLKWTSSRWASQQLLKSVVPILPCSIIRRTYNAQTLLNLRQLGDEVLIKPDQCNVKDFFYRVSTTDFCHLQANLDQALELCNELFVQTLPKARHFSNLTIDNRTLSCVEVTKPWHSTNFEPTIISYAPKLPASLTSEIELFSKNAYQHLDCCLDLRCDFSMDSSGKLYLTDVNTDLLFLDSSFLFNISNAHGLPPKNLIQHLIDLSISNTSRGEQTDFSVKNFNTGIRTPLKSLNL